MPLSAIICATAPSADSPDLPRAQLHFVGQNVMEYQARQARDAGIGHVIILVDAVTPALSLSVDRLNADGVQVQLIRDMATLVRDVPRETDLLLFSDGALVDQQYVLKLAQVGGSNLLVTEDGPTTAHLERIDGVHRWCGLARITPDILFGTLDLIGDWDFALTLLRAAVQSNARRITLPASDYFDGHAAMIDRQATADLVAQNLLRPNVESQSADAGAEHYVLRPLVNMLSARFVRMQTPSIQLRLGAVALGLAGLLMLYPAWSVLAILFFLAALTGNLVADRLSTLARRDYADGWIGLAPVALVLSGMVIFGAQHGNWDSALYLACLCGVIHLAIRWKRGYAMEKWAYLTPGTALLMLLLGIITGHAPLLVQMATLLSIGSLARLVLRDRRRSQ